MKKLLSPALRFLFLLLLQTGFAQTPDSCFSGVYLTKDDFLRNHLSYKINESVKGEKLTFTFPADLTLTVKIVDKDTIIKFSPGQIYGYKQCEDVFRFFPGAELSVQEDFYKIEEVKGLILYSSAFYIAGTETFYSLDLSSPIHRLTYRNLKKQFNEYPGFLKALKKIRADVTDRDENGYFKVNRLYRETVWKQNNIP
jgi:hypothetical protein